MVVRPGSNGFDAFGLLVLVSVLFVSLRDLSTRAQCRIATAGPAHRPVDRARGRRSWGLGIGRTEEWIVAELEDLLQLAGAGLLLTIGYFTAIAAMRLGDMSVTAPFRYVAVVFAIVVGYLVWGEVPDTLTMLGSGVIVGAGLYTLYRETTRCRAGAP